jgi:hypothetical protein
MSTTLALDDDLVRIAQEFTGVREKDSSDSRSAESSHRARERPPTGLIGRHHAEIKGYSTPQDSAELILLEVFHSPM